MKTVLASDILICVLGLTYCVWGTNDVKRDDVGRGGVAVCNGVVLGTTDGTSANTI